MIINKLWMILFFFHVCQRFQVMCRLVDLLHLSVYISISWLAQITFSQRISVSLFLSSIHIVSCLNVCQFISQIHVSVYRHILNFLSVSFSTRASTCQAIALNVNLCIYLFFMATSFHPPGHFPHIKWVVWGKISFQHFSHWASTHVKCWWRPGTNTSDLQKIKRASLAIAQVKYFTFGSVCEVNIYCVELSKTWELARACKETQLQ